MIERSTGVLDGVLLHSIKDEHAIESPLGGITRPDVQTKYFLLRVEGPWPASAATRLVIVEKMTRVIVVNSMLEVLGLEIGL